MLNTVKSASGGKKLILALIFLLSVSIAHSQWQPDARLTNNSGSSNTSGQNIAASGSTIHVTWYDDRDGNYEIYYKRSTDAGLSWGADVRITNQSNISWDPSISASGMNVLIVWVDTRDGFFAAYYKQSTDNGATWGPHTRVTSTNSVQTTPFSSYNGNIIHLVWVDERDGNQEIYYKHSVNNGNNWSSDDRITSQAEPSRHPRIASPNLLNTHIVWEDYRDGPDPEIYYKRSTDGGDTWGGAVRLTNNADDSEYPAITASGTNVFVAWDDDRDGNSEIYFKRSTNNGSSWGADTRLTYDPGVSTFPSIFSSSGSFGQYVHIAWQDTRDGVSNYEIYYKLSSDYGTSFLGDTRLTNNASFSGVASIAALSNSVNIIWEENRDGNSEIYYKRNPTGNPVGVTNINSEIPEEFSLSQNYPNPFNPVTNIKFAIPKSGLVKIVVFDVMGREVEIIVNQQMQPGIYNADWNAGSFSSGVYYYKIEAEGFIETKKMILVK